MVVALILVSIGFAITLGMLLFGGKSGTDGTANRSSVSSPSFRGELESETKARAKAESEVQRKQKELDEQRAQLQEVKEQLKQTKRKLFDQKEGDKGAQDLVKARAEVERNASIQLAQTREELSHALTENAKLRAEADSRGGNRRREAPAPVQAVTPAPAPVAAAPASTDLIAAPASEPVVSAAVSVPSTPVAPAEPVRRYRELNDADREKMDRLETAANKDRARAVELEKELRRIKGRADTQARILAVTKSEADLGKDKYKALEKRLNRTLLERDLLRRAIKDLEKKTGMLADRTELTPDEVAASDQRSDEVARARAEAEARAAAPATPTEAAPVETAAPASTEGEAKPSEAPSSNA
ncbi:cell envelope biogenesis protein TolA [Corallococcus praedator]|uniref:Cell envelope biogenesis protein TolA n=1 Tax=Corallococcus praedator TaxID=2316724 RepID=A0ABX9QNJ4_9BACT|nr:MULTISPECIES: cell envelope biogenesis protein TolA [Corallococcus]RKH33306.1 cell envelope biogenesis protein TolA [Corallococcus sp. CA031C]RKI12267.1 cell envelope biogenesis protein TolA [Corallococcus praedator]